MITSVLILSSIHFWASNNYTSLQERSYAARTGLQTWYAFHAEVSNYLKQRMEDLAKSGPQKPYDMERMSSAMNAILKNARVEDISTIEKVRKLISHMDRFFVAAKKINSPEKAAEYFLTNIEEYDYELSVLVAQNIEREAQVNIHIKSDLDSTKKALDFTVLLFAVLVTLGCVGSIARINRSVLNSVNSLIAGIGNTNSGKLNSPIAVQQNDELGKVAIAFNEMIKDLNNSKELIEEQQKKMVVTAKMSALGEMAGGVAHEINNPLAIINIVIDQLDDGIQDGTLGKAGVRKMADQIRLTVDRIAKIVSGLRSFSREAKDDPAIVANITTTVTETLSFCQERFRENEVKLITEGLDQELLVKCRPTQISQVLLNLLNNAYDAVLGLPVKWVRLSVVRHRNGVEITITDSGPGIPASILAKIFQPFFTTKDIGKGTGLGLSISKGIVEEHGGTVSVNDQSSNTCFVIGLPLSDEKAA